MSSDLPKGDDFFVIGAKYTHNYFKDVYMRVNAIHRTSPSTVNVNLSFFDHTHKKPMNDCWFEIDELTSLWSRHGDS